MRFWKEGPPVVRALAAQGLVFAGLAAMAVLLAPRLPLWAWALAQGTASALLARRWGLGSLWYVFQLALPFALVWQLTHAVPGWVYPVALLGTLLIFGGGLASRVPLYTSSHAAWRALEELLPAPGPFRMVDLGAGLGGPLSHLARHRPESHFTGVEASPLTWLLAWLRVWPLRRNCRMAFGSLWRHPLHDYQVAYAFLSPAPMAELWAKARQEMAPGTIFISNTFAIPGAIAEREVQLPDREDARLLVYRL